MRRSANVATPFTAFAWPPVSVPPPGLAPIVSVMTPVKLVTTAPASLRASTKTGGAIAAPPGGFPGGRVETPWVAPGGGRGGAVEVEDFRAASPRPGGGTRGGLAR